MPIYEYRCKDCEQIFEEWQKAYDVDEADCPVCGGNAARIVSNTSFVLKGGGWYVSEYGQNSASSSSPPAKSADSSSGDSTPAKAPSTPAAGESAS